MVFQEKLQGIGTKCAEHFQDSRVFSIYSAFGQLSLLCICWFSGTRVQVVNPIVSPQKFTLEC